MSERSRRLFLILLLSVFLSVPLSHAADVPSASQVMSEAKAQAASQHKGILLIFGASWCGWCRKLEQLDSVPEVSVILDKNDIIVHLTVLEHKDKAQLDNPGAEELMKSLGGQGSLPFFAFLDADAQPIVTSNRPSALPPDRNIGFPGNADEIAWYLAMVRKAVPSLTADQERMLENRINALLH